MATLSSSEAATIGIREATDADLPWVVETLNAEIAASPFLYREVPITLGERLRWLDAHRTAGLPVVVAALDDALLGWAALSTYRAASGYRYTAEVSVYVEPRAQRRGVGRSLVTALHEWAARSEIKSIVASIDSENAASIGLFERLGYREVGRLSGVGHKFGGWRTELLLLRGA